MDKKKAYYTTKEIAEECGVEDRSVRYWITNGLLEAERLTPKSPYRISAASWEAFTSKTKK